MRIRRYKKAFKSLSFYVNNFGFHKPFQLLIDGTFCFAALVVSVIFFMVLYFQSSMADI